MLYETLTNQILRRTHVRFRTIGRFFVKLPTRVKTSYCRLACRLNDAIAPRGSRDINRPGFVDNSALRSIRSTCTQRALIGRVFRFTIRNTRISGRADYEEGFGREENGDVAVRAQRRVRQSYGLCVSGRRTSPCGNNRRTCIGLIGFRCTPFPRPAQTPQIRRGHLEFAFFIIRPRVIGIRRKSKITSRHGTLVSLFVDAFFVRDTIGRFYRDGIFVSPNKHE